MAERDTKGLGLVLLQGKCLETGLTGCGGRGLDERARL